MLQPTSAAEEEQMLAAALAASVATASKPSSTASSPSRYRSSDVECSEKCGRFCSIGPNGKVMKTCCMSCRFLKQEKGICGHDLECDVRDNDGLRPPWYWRCGSLWPESFHEEVGGEYVRNMGTTLLRRHLPEAEVIRADRIEDCSLWNRYAARRAALRFAAQVEVEDVKPETFADITFSAKTTLDRSVNEVYLFHGTSAQAARAIAQSSFRPSSAGCFGAGAYFADAAHRSDTYAKTNEDGTKIMLLCRVALGSIKTLPEGQDREASTRLARDSVHNSLVGTTTFGREFVIWDVDQVYPEYMLFYTKNAKLRV